MAAVGRIVQTASRLLRNGRGDPDFFELVRELENATGAVGRSDSPGTERVRFGQVPSLAFPRTTVAEVSERADMILVLVAFLGLAGPTGPLPLALTELVFRRAHNEYDFSPRRFLDIVNHRFIGLYYRAWRRTEQAASADRPEDDLVGGVVKALAGGTRFSAPPALPGRAEKYDADLFGSPCKTADGLAALLYRHLRLRIEVVPHRLSRIAIPREYWCVPGRRGCSELGRSMQLGCRCWSRSAKFLLRTEPLSYSEGSGVMPGSPGFLRLSALVLRYLDRPLDFDLEVVLRLETVPDPVLDGSLRLGGGIWLGGKGMGMFSHTVAASRLLGRGRRPSRACGGAHRRNQGDEHGEVETDPDVCQT